MKKLIIIAAILMASLVALTGPALCVSKSDLLALLNWENSNLSFTSDLSSKTVASGRTITRESRIYKLGQSLLRIDTEPVLMKAYNQQNQHLGDFYMIRNAASKKAYMVFPDKKAYVETSTDELKKIMQEMGKQIDDKTSNSQKVKSFEKLGKTSLEGISCEKFHAITEDRNGITYDITAWLATAYNHFPLKTIIKSTIPGGQHAENTMLFHNIKKRAPAKSLFEIPSGYRKYKNLVQLNSNGKAGGGIEVFKNRLKNRRR